MHQPARQISPVRLLLPRERASSGELDEAGKGTLEVKLFSVRNRACKLLPASILEISKAASSYCQQLHLYCTAQER